MKLFNVHQVQDVKEIIMKEFKPINEYIEVPLMQSLGMVLAEDIIVDEDIPSFNRSTVDGYAVMASNTFGSSMEMPSLFNIVGSVEMGEVIDRPILYGETMYVPTGGMVPKGADAVVMVENVEVIGDLLNVYKQVTPKENIIFQGEDVKNGEIILQKGHRLRPQDLGALAAIGVAMVTVYRKLKIGILSTGDEIVPPDTKKLLPGQIRDINGISLSATIQTLGQEVVYDGIVKDNFDDYMDRSQKLFDEVDFLILSGGSSMGEKDYTSQVINNLGEPGVLVHGVSIKPGKPTIVANCNGKPVMGLPGHPVSAYVLFDLFGTLIIDQLHGVTDTKHIQQLKARITRNVPSQVGRTDIIRVKLEVRDDELWASPVFGKSGMISNLVKSDGMVEIPQYNDGIIEGEWVNVILYY